MDKYKVIDNALENSVFQSLQEKVVQSWLGGRGWQIQDHRGQTFSYYYYALHQSGDTSGIINEIYMALEEKYWPLFLSLAKETITKRSFSLSCFIDGCFLSYHNDSPSQETPYKLSILLYFGLDNQFNLHFDSMGQRSVVVSRENRCVIFKPRPETMHAVLANKRFPCAHRLAFSGWLL